MVKLTKRAQALLGLGAFGGGLAYYYYCYLNNQCPVNKIPTAREKPKSCQFQNAPPVETLEKCGSPEPVESDKQSSEHARVPQNHFYGFGNPRHNVILVRRGEFNFRGKDPKTRVLTKIGQKQAKLTAARLGDLPAPWQELVASTSVRVKETAEIIAKETNLAIKYSDLISEADRHIPEQKERMEKAYQHYLRAPPEDQKEQTFSILVCHSNVIRYFVCRALGCPIENLLHMGLYHGCITWISIKPNGDKIVWTVGEISHIPSKYLTYVNEY
ncbi:serine/threonine-protein phosphatase Pgam5, mitochondrial-like [Pectinophora gossypiella]|uniref:serine/threonine-protein phosphatase Pgam5, mitochondrial-like n=1 Tax=Pectinophora gossypiella TaxID=13191 RepID=UPI00214F2A55|nr:serine/threonine-protein phosphatase Pgam5, mitochondrial-like [Pectinophora gossypiella]